MRFLDTRGVARFDRKEMIGKPRHLPAAGPRQSHRDQSLHTRCLERGDYIGAVARGGDAHQHVTRVPQSLNLPRKDRLVAIIIGYSGQYRRIRGQRH